MSNLCICRPIFKKSSKEKKSITCTKNNERHSNKMLSEWTSIGFAGVRIVKTMHAIEIQSECLHWTEIEIKNSQSDEPSYFCSTAHSIVWSFCLCIHEQFEIRSPWIRISCIHHYWHVNMFWLNFYFFGDLILAIYFSVTIFLSDEFKNGIKRCVHFNVNMIS